MFGFKPQSAISDLEQNPVFHKKEEIYSSDYENKISCNHSTQSDIKIENVQTDLKYNMASASINISTYRESYMSFQNQECSQTVESKTYQSNEAKASKQIQTQSLHSNTELQNRESPNFYNKKFLQQFNLQNQQNNKPQKFHIKQSILSEKQFGANIQKSNQENPYQFLKIDTFKENENKDMIIQKSDDYNIYNLVVLPEKIKSIELQIHLFLDQSNMNQINMQQYLDNSFVIDSAKIRLVFKDQRDQINSDKQQSLDSSSLIKRRKNLIKQITLSSQTKTEQNQPLEILKSSQSQKGSCNDFIKKYLKYQQQNLRE